MMVNKYLQSICVVVFVTQLCSASILLYEDFPVRKATAEMQEGEEWGEVASDGGWQLSVSGGNAGARFVLGARPLEFQGFDQLELEVICQTSGDIVLEVSVEALSPKHGKMGGSRFHLRQGAGVYTLALQGVGQPIKFSRLVFVVHTSVPAVLEIHSIRLAATTKVADADQESLLERLNKPLPPGLSDNAVHSGMVRRQNLYNALTAALERINAPATQQEILRCLATIYDIKEFGDVHVQQEAFCQQASEAEGIFYGWTGGADKILRDGPFPGQIGGVVRVSLARNEAEAAQIAIYSATTLHGVSAVVRELCDDDGHVFPSDAVTVCPVGYVTTTPPAYFSEYAPYALPDPLLEYLSEFDVERERFQPVWLEFAAVKEQPPGIYRGRIEFQAGGATLLSVPLELTVHRFQLPDQMSLPAVVSCGLFHSPLYEADGIAHQVFEKYMYSEDGGDPSALSAGARRLVQINDELFQLLNRHHVTFQDIYRSTRRVIPGWRRRVINQYNTMYCLGYDNDSMVAENFERQFAAMRREGTADRAYIYGYDEIRASDRRAFAKMKQSYGLLKTTFPELKTMATALDYSFGEKTGTTDEVDIWVVPPDAYLDNLAAAERARARGKQVWYYPCNWPYPPAANFLLENTAVASRVLCGFFPWKFRADGFLYYSAGMLQRQAQTESLLGRWETSGDVEVVTAMPWEFDNAYRLRKTAGGKDARLLRWALLPRNLRKPLIAHAEVLLERLSTPEPCPLAVEIRLNYVDGTTESYFLEADGACGDWQSLRREITLSGPLRNLLYAVRLTAPDATAQVRGMKLFQEGEQLERRLAADKLLAGGPLFGPEYCYSMFRSNGDGTLFYPAPDGVLPSLRLKFIRDGLEDYEYLVLLRKAFEQAKCALEPNCPPAAWLEEASRILEVPDTVCHSLTRYAKTGEVLLDYREDIARLLDQISPNHAPQ